MAQVKRKQIEIYSSFTLDWNAASAYCVARKKNLVTFATTEEEKQLVKDIIDAYNK